MVDMDRVRYFEECVRRAKEDMAWHEKRRDEYIEMRSKGDTMTNQKGEDLLAAMIELHDSGMLQYSRVVRFLEGNLGRAQAGEDI